MKNPLAREIVDACQALGLDVVFEPGKMHPKDWANPGRVRVGLRRGGRVKNSKSIHPSFLALAGLQNPKAEVALEEI